MSYYLGAVLTAGLLMGLVSARQPNEYLMGVAVMIFAAMIVVLLIVFTGAR